MRERITLQIAADTPLDEIERLRRGVRDEIRLPENRRDFRDDVDVELVSVGDMSKLEVYVEAEHKVCLFDLMRGKEKLLTEKSPTGTTSACGASVATSS